MQSHPRIDDTSISPLSGQLFGGEEKAIETSHCKSIADSLDG